MDDTNMSMNHALSSHLLGSFEQSRRAATPAFGTQPLDLTRHGFLPAAHGSLSQATSISNFSSADQLAAMQAKLNKKLGPEFLSQRPGPGGGPKLTYAEGWKIINLANEVFGFNGWSSSVLSITTDYMDYSESTQRYSVGVSAVIRVTLRDGAFHEDVGFGCLENARSKGMALDKCKKEAVTDGLKRTMRNFGNVLGNCLYDKQYVSEITKVKAPVAKLDKDALHRRPDLAGPVPNMPAPTMSPLPPSISSPQNRTTPRQVGNPSPLATRPPIINRVPAHNLPTPDTSIDNANASTNQPQANAPQHPQDRTARSVPRPNPAAPAPVQRSSSETNPEGELAGELAADGSIYGSEDESFFDNILPGELDMDVAEIPPAPVAPNDVQPVEQREPPAGQPTNRSNPELSISAQEPSTVPITATNLETPNPPRPNRLRLADAIRGGAPGQKIAPGFKRAAPPDSVGQKKQRMS